MSADIFPMAKENNRVERVNIFLYILTFGVEEGWGGVGVVVNAEFYRNHLFECVHGEFCRFLSGDVFERL